MKNHCTKNHSQYLVPRKFPRSLGEAFPNSPDYASSVYINKDKPNISSKVLYSVALVVSIISFCIVVFN